MPNSPVAGIKGGSALPMKRAGFNTKQNADELILHVYNGSPSTFDLYEDDGETFDYQKGKSSRRTLALDRDRLTLTKSEGDYTSNWKTIVVYFHGFAKLRDAKAIDFSYFTPIEKYDPINDPEWIGSESVQVMTFPFTVDSFEFRF